MKWSVLALVVIGLIAATAAAVLVSSLKAGGRPVVMQGAGSSEIEVLLAARDLPEMAVVEGSNVVREKMTRDKAPEGCLTDSVQVVGRVLSMPVVKGQPFRQAHFARPTAAALAAAVRQGKRAVMLSLTPDAAMMNLLYPGCVVDVLASFEVPTPDGHGKETASVTVLQGIQVLAVEDKTVLNEEEPKATSGGQYSQRRLVTVLVSPKEAELLQLVRNKGEVSLTMRNPLEQAKAEASSTVLSQVLDLYSRQAPPPMSEAEPATSGYRPTWSVTILRGGQEEQQTYAMPVEVR